MCNYHFIVFYVQFHTNASITHSNRERQDNLEFYWKPPTNSSFTGNVTFYATIAENKLIYWEMEKSNSVPLKMVSICCQSDTTGIRQKFTFH